MGGIPTPPPPAFGDNWYIGLTFDDIWREDGGHSGSGGEWGPRDEGDALAMAATAAAAAAKWGTGDVTVVGRGDRPLEPVDPLDGVTATVLLIDTAAVAEGGTAAPPVGKPKTDVGVVVDSGGEIAGWPMAAIVAVGACVCGMMFGLAPEDPVAG